MYSTCTKKVSRGRSCAGCTNNQGNSKDRIPKVRFHRFPDPIKDKKRFTKWCCSLKKVRLRWDHPYNCGKTEGPWPNTVVCSDHFPEDCYYPNSSRLKNDAVPKFSTLKTTAGSSQRTTLAAKRAQYSEPSHDGNPVTKRPRITHEVISPSKQASGSSLSPSTSGVSPKKARFNVSLLCC